MKKEYFVGQSFDVGCKIGEDASDYVMQIYPIFPKNRVLALNL
jgi:hypothetical protein